MFIVIAAALVSNSIVPPAAVPMAARPAPAASAPVGRYNPRVCVVDQITGSRIPVRTCKLLAQWRTDGVDPLPGR